MRIVVTGARGKLGSRVLKYVQERGDAVLGVDSSQPGDARTFLHAELTDIGQVYDALSGADAVIHLAAIPHQRLFPGVKTFMTNVGSTYNVFEAAARLGIKRVVAASSIQVNRSAYPRSPANYRYLPLDEDHPTDAQDEYGLSKLVGEVCADTFAQHWGLTIVSLRFTWIASEEEVQGLPHGPRYDDAMLHGYVHVDDAARACYLAATADMPASSHTVAFVTAQDSPLDTPTLEVVRRAFPDAETRAGLEEYGSMVSGARAAAAFGFVAERRFRQ